MVIIEIQRNEDRTSILTDVQEDRSAAESSYHTRLAAAAVSSLAAHSVALLDDYGNLIKSETYSH